MENLIHRREAIILTTIEIINELGIQGLTTKEIAKRQGISEGTIFKHYTNKNDILINVIDYFCKYDKDIIASIKMKNLDGIDAINFFISAYTEYYQSYPEITAILHSLDILGCDKNLYKKIKEALQLRYDFIYYMIEKAKLINQIDSKINSEALTDIIIGSFNGICLKWRLNDFDFNLKNKVFMALETALQLSKN